MAMAALVMAGALWFAKRTVFAEMGTTAGLRWLALGVLVGSGVVAYVLAAQLLGAFDLREFLGVMRRSGRTR